MSDFFERDEVDGFSAAGMEEVETFGVFNMGPLGEGSGPGYGGPVGA